MRKLFGAALAAGAMLWASQASAAVITTFTGTLNSGFDTTGVFGTANTSLAGAAFTAVYSFDSLQLVASGPGYVDHYGVGVKTSLTINGVTVEMAGYEPDPSQSEAEIYSTTLGGSTTQFQVSASDRRIPPDAAPHYLLSMYNYVNSTTTQFDYSTSFTYSPLPGDSTGGTFDYFRGDAGTGVYTSLASGSFKPTSVSVVASAGAVPEPAGWAMMLVGFFGAGAALRTARSPRQRIAA